MPSSFNHWLGIGASQRASSYWDFRHRAGAEPATPRGHTNLVIKQASAPGRSAQLREQQTRTLAGVLYGAGSKVVG